MAYDNILLVQESHLLRITINRPEKLNALNKHTIAELSDAFEKAENSREIRVVILTGAGNKAFVAGADISEFAHFEVIEGEKLSAEGHKLLFNKVEAMGTPVIAAINGFALGGGLELAMSCHMRLASSTAKMGLPEVSLGVIPGYGGTQRLAQLVGKGRALEMICTAKMIDAQEAYRTGLVNGISEPDELLNDAEKMAGQIMKNSPVAISGAIRSVNAQFTENVNGYSVEIDAFGKCFGSDDFKEGTRAFLEKRKPVFEGK
jgi:enoyl-CoA hydratase